MTPFIELVSVSKNYEKGNEIIKVLNNISLKIKEGDFVVVLGPSGSGKSTFLNLLSLIDNVSSGNIYYKGEEIDNLSLKEKEQFQKNNISFVYQDSNLIPYLTVYENILMGSYISNNPKDINELLQTFNLTSLKDKYPYMLSGGQKQIISILRSLIKNSPIMLLDEPTSSLDKKTKDNVLNVLSMANKQYKTTIILVTHDEDIINYSNYNVVIKDGYIVKKTHKRKEK